jgi:hypothetical protein
MSQALINDARLTVIFEKLKERPCTVAELAEAIDRKEDTARKFVNLLIENQFVENIPKSAYYQITEKERQRQGMKYPDYATEADIKKIPEYYFREIPTIRRWWQLSIGTPSKEARINAFANICYGRTVKGFTIHPADWKHPETTERFYREYKTQHGKEYPEHIIKALRAFLHICLNVNLETNSNELALLGLKTPVPKGKYRFIEFNADEEKAAKEWLKNEGIRLAKIQGLDPDGLLAHYAFATEGFPRPSRVLSIETARIAYENGVIHWLMWETKQGTDYPKFIKDADFITWAKTWVEKRRFLKRRYLFLDDNNYESRLYESAELDDERSPYREIYKAMFQAIGKQETIYYQKTLYCLRHIGVMRWAKRLGLKGMVIIQQMGWEDMKTLLRYYLGVRPSDIMAEIMKTP